MKSFHEGDRNPRLLAEIGLLECDAGNDNKAWSYLHLAVEKKVVHPRVYYELARIEYAPLKPLEPERKLTAKQVDHVIGLLKAAVQQSPPLPEAFELMAEVWMQSEFKLQSTQFKFLQEGTRLYPRRVKLIYATALLNALNQEAAEAAALVTKGLLVATNEEQRNLFLNLRTAMENDSLLQTYPNEHPLQ